MPVANTSLLAYNSIIKGLGKRQLEVLHTIRVHGPITNKEISRLQARDINTITPRVKELREECLVYQHGTKLVEGFVAKTWAAVYPKELF